MRLIVNFKKSKSKLGLFYYRKKLNILKITKRIRWFLNKPKLPIGNTQKIHLGCGEINIPGFINVDKLCFPHIHFRTSVSKLKFAKDNTIDLIYMSHCLEHIPRMKIDSTLKEYHRVLKKKGILRISVPDFDTIIKMYKSKNEIKDIIAPLMGGQDYAYNFHFTVFNKKFLSELLHKAGFTEVKEWKYGEDPYKSVSDWSGKEIIIDDNPFFISLNIEAVK